MTPQSCILHFPPPCVVKTKLETLLLETFVHQPKTMTEPQSPLSLVKLCIGVLRDNFSVCMKHIVELPVSMLEKVLPDLGRQVDAELLTAIDKFNGKDKVVREMLEEYWERLCKANFKGRAQQLAQDKPERSWRKRYRKIEKEREKMLQRSEERLRKRKKENAKDKKRKKTKLLEVVPPIPTVNRFGTVSTSGPVQRNYSRSNPFSAQSASKERLAKVLNKAAKNQRITRPNGKM